MAAARLVEILNMGALNAALAIGYKNGLFEAMDSLENPSNCSTIAAVAGCHPRYVKEWLSVMVCGDIVSLTAKEGEEDLFFLPRELGDLLCQRAGAGNLGVYMQEIPLLTSLALPQVSAAFKTGNGVGYKNYEEFYDFMTELSVGKHQRTLCSTFLPSVDDGRLETLLKEGIRVCDIGCSEGTEVILMAEAYPHSTFVGIDLVASVIESGRQRAAQKQLTNVQFICADAAHFLDDDNVDNVSRVEYQQLVGTFDYVLAIDAIHDQQSPERALQHIHSLLRDGGHFSLIDIKASSSLAKNTSHSMGTFLYGVSMLHCLPVGLDGLGAGLGMMWGRERAESMLVEAGFSAEKIKIMEMVDDSFNMHFYCQK